MKEITITKAQSGQRLDRFLGRCLPLASGGFLHKMLRKKNIKVNGLKADGSEKLQSGDKIQIYFSDETYEKFRGEAKNFEFRKTETHKNRRAVPRDEGLRKKVKILYKDDDVLILHKPAGMLSQKATKEDDSLNDYLLDLCLERKWISEEEFRYFHPSVANRLDRNTSGIVLCGITTEGLQLLSQVLKDRSISKYYLALVAGKPSHSRKIKGYLTKDTEKNIVHFSESRQPDAVPIETEYELLKTGKDASLLRIRLITGKSHQIRAHLASEGHPIIGDYKYGNRNINQILKQSSGIFYQMLHSYEIDFGKHLHGLVVKDELPDEFLRAMDLFGIENVRI